MASEFFKSFPDHMIPTIDQWFKDCDFNPDQFRFWMREQHGITVVYKYNQWRWKTFDYNRSMMFKIKYGL